MKKSSGCRTVLVTLLAADAGEAAVAGSFCGSCQDLDHWSIMLMLSLTYLWEVAAGDGSVGFGVTQVWTQSPFLDTLQMFGSS